MSGCLRHLQSLGAMTEEVPSSIREEREIKINFKVYKIKKTLIIKIVLIKFKM